MDLAAGNKAQECGKKERHSTSVTQTKYDDSLNVEPSRMLQTSNRVWIRIEEERQTRELMFHALGTHRKNSTGGSIQGDCVCQPQVTESLMPPLCGPFSQPGNDPTSYLCDSASSYHWHLFLNNVTELLYSGSSTLAH